MESCLYEGRVVHRRHAPVDHRFEFPLFMTYLDLAELGELFDGDRLWSCDRPALAWFRRADHLGNPDSSLDMCVRELVKRETGELPLGPIRLLTNLRYAGFAMNPVSFYYCFDPEGRRIRYVVAEVTNTPWGEQHCYVLSPSTERLRGLDARVAKQFHVSPFMPMDLEYRFRFGEPGSELRVGIENRDQSGRLMFHAGLFLRRLELDRSNRRRMLLRHPFMTLQTFAAIYWQAARLGAIGAPFFRHPRTSAPSPRTT